MTYTLLGCAPIDPTDADVVQPIVDLIASYAGADGANFCSLFSDTTYASVCFPGVVLDVPVTVAAEIVDAVLSLQPHLVGYNNVEYMMPGGTFLPFPFTLTGSRP